MDGGVAAAQVGALGLRLKAEQGGEPWQFCHWQHSCRVTAVAYCSSDTPQIQKYPLGLGEFCPVKPLAYGTGLLRVRMVASGIFAGIL